LQTQIPVMKTILVLLCGLALSSPAQTVIKHDKIIIAGLGLGSGLFSGEDYYGTVPPVSVSMEYMVLDHLFGGRGMIGMGAGFCYSAYKYDIAGWGWEYNTYIPGMHINLHYCLIQKMDTYLGGFVG